MIEARQKTNSQHKGHEILTIGGMYTTKTGWTGRHMARLTDSGRRWCVGLDCGRLPLSSAYVDEPGPHLVPQLPVAVVDALEILLFERVQRECKQEEVKGRGRAAGHPRDTQRLVRSNPTHGPPGPHLVTLLYLRLNHACNAVN